MPWRLAFCLSILSVPIFASTSSPGPYQRLWDSYKNYLGLSQAGGWPSIPEGPRLRAGDRGKRVVLLRKRLAMSGDLKAASQIAAMDFFDGDLEAALSVFQENHSLVPNGELDEKTRMELNIPVDSRLATMRANLERWQKIGSRGYVNAAFVLVDIAKFQVRLYKAGVPVLSLRAIVGEKGKETPVFQSRITRIDINPWWNMPQGIAVHEALPQLKADPDDFLRQKIKVVDVSKEPREVDPKKIDWAKVDEHHFHYSFRQAPGPENPLGPILFRLPNAYLIFLHGTPDDWLFHSTARPFSHGCVRMEKPLDLANDLLQGEKTGLSVQKLQKEILSGKSLSHALSSSMPIYFSYWTAWVNEQGALEFRPDIYGWDEPQEQKLAE